METVRIHVNQQSDGITFSLPLATRQSLLQEFPNAHPVSSLFVAYDVRHNFEFYHGTIEPQIFPVMLGLTQTNLQKIKTILFVNPVTNQTIYKYPHE
ncbi:hypothetical protein [Spirosoma aerolatum]|uniref:hypothetical protein n=1 Tax=Spirosoma aerolatum TaxID=1211326 RepID=UPI0009AEF345|nr:hypothetical protein [Spirosoma aerolatum]